MSSPIARRLDRLEQASYDAQIKALVEGMTNEELVQAWEDLNRSLAEDMVKKPAYAGLDVEDLVQRLMRGEDLQAIARQSWPKEAQEGYACL